MFFFVCVCVRVGVSFISHLYFLKWVCRPYLMLLCVQHC